MRPKHRTPAIILPLGVEREMHSDRDVGMPLEHRHRLLIPGSREHDGDRNRQSRIYEFLESQVDTVAHPAIVAADDQIDRVCAGRARECGRRSDSMCRGYGHQLSAQQQSEGRKQLRTTLQVGSPVSLLFTPRPSNPKSSQVVGKTPCITAWVWKLSRICFLFRRWPKADFPADGRLSSCQYVPVPG